MVPNTRALLLASQRVFSARENLARQMQRGDWTAGIAARCPSEENTSLSVSLRIKIEKKKNTLSDPDQVVSEQFFSRSFDPPGSDVAMQFLMLIAVTLYEIFFFWMDEWMTEWIRKYFACTESSKCSYRIRPVPCKQHLSVLILYLMFNRLRRDHQTFPGMSCSLWPPARCLFVCLCFFNLYCGELKVLSGVLTTGSCVLAGWLASQFPLAWDDRRKKNNSWVEKRTLCSALRS